MAAEASSGAASSPASTPAKEGKMRDPRADDFEFNIAVDVVYHRARAGWLTWAHRALLFGAIIFGSVAATDVANAKGCAILAAACAALDIVFDPIGTAGVHRGCLRTLHRILMRLRKADFSTDSVDAADEEMMDLSVEEPAPYNLLRLLAFHEAAIALGREHPAKQPVAWYARPFVNVLRFEGW